MTEERARPPRIDISGPRYGFEPGSHGHMNMDPACPNPGIPDDASLTNWDMNHKDRGKFGYCHIAKEDWEAIFGEPAHVEPDIFTEIMDTEGCTFPQAVERVHEEIVLRCPEGETWTEDSLRKAILDAAAARQANSNT